METLALIDLLLALVDRASRAGALIRQARAEGRDVTSAELETLAAEDDAARAELVAAIDRAKADGR